MGVKTKILTLTDNEFFAIVSKMVDMFGFVFDDKSANIKDLWNAYTELSLSQLETSFENDTDMETALINKFEEKGWTIDTYVEGHYDKYVRGGVLGGKKLFYLLFSPSGSNNPYATIRFFLEERPNANYFEQLGEIQYYTGVDNSYSFTRFTVEVEAYHKADKFRKAYSIMKFIHENRVDRNDINAVLEILKGEELIIDKTTQSLVPKSYVGQTIFNVFGKNKPDQLYTYVYAPNLAVAKKRGIAKIGKKADVDFNYVNTGEVVENSRDEVQFKMGGNINKTGFKYSVGGL